MQRVTVASVALPSPTLVRYGLAASPTFAGVTTAIVTIRAPFNDGGQLIEKSS